MLTASDQVELLIDDALIEIRNLIFECPESEIDHEYCCALVRVAWARGVKDCYEKFGGPNDLRADLSELGFEL